MQLRSNDFSDQQPIPEALAFGRPGADGEPCVLSANRNPHLAWSDAPTGTRSFALLCIDGDVPTVGDDVNQPGRRVPASLPRTEFVHWLLVDVPGDQREIAQGACSDGVTAHGKREPHGPQGSRQGLNDYTGWFAGDAAMAGDYLGYDGPCPPWNDDRLHHYRFVLCALDVARLDLPPRFGLADVRTAMQGHVLAEATLTGTYTLNPALRR
ncbi:YbhB/YbcL family Raf kinase inhibitor-like protein [Dokdonella sp.]|uniref:YbhB/YbcL family Raf kinase inhibitor-like protein n=1 Tax=Dokdonella sp. TaxID=2291710 RepID=UPI001B0F109E|nr:YbhB/YbcL family Raf kinase inhibitor-like protein [Dokdonella sp.]MBO9661393.1 YbhB/YbcL family Raf kinase inhibitor-like protein [Dokdonella sp.]